MLISVLAISLCRQSRQNPAILQKVLNRDFKLRPSQSRVKTVFGDNLRLAYKSGKLVWTRDGYDFANGVHTQAENKRPLPNKPANETEVFFFITFTRSFALSLFRSCRPLCVLTASESGPSEDSQ